MGFEIDADGGATIKVKVEISQHLKLEH